MTRPIVSAAKTHRCRRWRRPLTDAASIARGIGPHCLRLLRQAQSCVQTEIGIDDPEATR